MGCLDHQRIFMLVKSVKYFYVFVETSVAAADNDMSLNNFSSYHPIIPKSYTPGWIQDMENRKLIIQNAEACKLPYKGTEVTLFLEKRERLCYKESQENTQTSKTHNHQQLEKRRKRIPLHSPLSKFQSSTMFCRQPQID